MDQGPISNGAPAQSSGTGAPDQTDAQKKLHDLLATLWKQRKSVVLERLSALEQAICTLEATGTEESRNTGADAAHKLAGILGTFGLPRGTDLAREAEVTLEKDGPVDADDLRRLHQVAKELSTLIDQR
jgi:HPt (histidine-containing phosphotransfer) domain-containing protein